jgi:aminoglycoside phosphotransferase (APT) family kinase protein
MTSPTGADPAVVGPYLATALGDPSWRQCTVALIAGGKSNLTFRVEAAGAAVVLRRPPLGHVLPTAHDMVREHTVMSALAGTPVPVPQMLHLCTDPAVLGAPFYVMELVDGHVCRSSLPPGYADDPAERRSIGEGLVDVLAALHAVEPAAVGLAEFGRPDGYLERQVRRWVKQWDATRIPAMTTSTRWPAPSRRTSRSPSAARWCTATTGSTTPCSRRTGPAASPRCSTGRCPRSGTRWPTSASCSATGRRLKDQPEPGVALVVPAATVCRGSRPAGMWPSTTPPAPA